MLRLRASSVHESRALSPSARSPRGNPRRHRLSPQSFAVEAPPSSSIHSLSIKSSQNYKINHNVCVSSAQYPTQQTPLVATQYLSDICKWYYLCFRPCSYELSNLLRVRPRIDFARFWNAAARWARILWAVQSRILPYFSFPTALKSDPSRSIVGTRGWKCIRRKNARDSVVCLHAHNRPLAAAWFPGRAQREWIHVGPPPLQRARQTSSLGRLKSDLGDRFLRQVQAAEKTSGAWTHRVAPNPAQRAAQLSTVPMVRRPSQDDISPPMRLSGRSPGLRS